MTKNYVVTIEHKPSKKRKGVVKFLIFFSILIGAVIATAYYLKTIASNCSNGDCNSLFETISNTIDPKLDKNDDGTTNVLIVGIDTRGENSGLMNTDTIIILSINHDTGSAMMTSIPRDFWVNYTLPNGGKTGSKINSIYAFSEMQKEGTGIEYLSKQVETMTGFHINYYAKITLAGFINLVDTIGGVDIEMPDGYKDAYPDTELPKELYNQCKPFYHDGRYCIFSYPAGTHHLDGQHALIYARTRIMSSDYDRARRQQIVINAIKEKILSTETLLNPDKLWDIYNIIKDNVESSKFTINDIRAALNLRDEIDTNTVASVVLDPSFGHTYGQFIKGGNDPGKGSHIIAIDSTYKGIKEYLGYISKYPGIYKEAPIISIYNATGNKMLEKDYAKLLTEENDLIHIVETNKVIKNADNTHQGIKIYRFNKDEMPFTEKYLKEFFSVNEIVTENIPEDIKALKGEHFVIVIGV